MLDDVKELIHDGRLSRWLQQQNHDAIPEDILEMDKESMEFSFALYRFFFDEENEKSIGEIAFILFCDTKNDDFLFRSVEESYPKALLELESRRKKAEEEARRKAAEEEARRKAEEEARRKAEAKRKAEEEARRKAEEEARRKAEEEARKKMEKYLLIGEDRYVELYKDCGVHSKFETNLSSLESDAYRILTFDEWKYLIAHISINNPLYEKYKNDIFFVYKKGYRDYDIGEISYTSVLYSANFIYAGQNAGTLLLFKDVEI